MDKPKKKSRILRWIFKFLLACLVGLGITVYLAKKGIPSTDNINDCFTTTMFEVKLCPKSGSYVTYNQLPKHLVYALVATEDASFFFHKGFDWDEIRDSLEKSLNAKRWVRGGSTITQQLAKNLYLTQERSLTRKLKEFFIARQIEKKLTKKQIIEKYFNVVEFGKNLYGIKAAANHYFGKSPASLTASESAYLVSLLPSPVRYSAAFHNGKELSSFNRKSVIRILNRLYAQKRITEDVYEMEKGRAIVGLWTPIIPADEDGIYWVNGERRSSELEEDPTVEESWRNFFNDDSDTAEDEDL